MVAVLLSGLALAALRGPNPLWMAVSFHLAIVLLTVAPIVAWARKDEGRFLWAAFAVAGWARLLFWGLVRGVPDNQAIAPWKPLVWQLRDVIIASPSLDAVTRTQFVLTCTYLDTILAGLLGAAVCGLALGIGRPPQGREGEAGA
jgi:hypothetical protein